MRLPSTPSIRTTQRSGDPRRAMFPSAVAAAALLFAAGSVAALPVTSPAGNEDAGARREAETNVGGSTVTEGEGPVSAPLVAGETDVISAAGVRVDPRVIEAISREGAAEVLVALREPLSEHAWETAPKSGAAAEAFDADAMAQAQAVQARVQAALPSDSFEETHHYELLAAMGGRLTASGLSVLERHPDVLAVGFSEEHVLMLAEHVPIVGGDKVHEEYGFTGEGIAVAVFDTGIDTDHPDLEDDLVDQQCYSRAGGCCCNNATQGKNAEDEGGHGTAVSGIISAKGVKSPPGIAPDASIVAVRVFNDRGGADNRDIVAGLDWVLRTFRTHNIKVINMSLGSTSTYTGRCDDAASETTRAAAVTKVVSRGIAIFAASGNGGATNAMSAPACLNKIIAVGATYDGNIGARGFAVCRDETTAVDQITCFTNRNRSLSILAPGSATTLPTMGGGAAGGWSGTSMASPMAAGAAALLFEADSGLRVNALQKLLEDTGLPIEDDDSSLTVPRINVYDALVDLVGPPPTPEASPTPEPSPSPEPSATPEATEVPTEPPAPTPGDPTEVPPTRVPVGTPEAEWRTFMPWAIRP